jgi:malonyl CoA-acyl carrier protein transacylase
MHFIVNAFVSPFVCQRLRGLAMQACRANQSDTGAMVALIPISNVMCLYLCKEIEETTGLVCEIANINSASQVSRVTCEMK